MKNGKNILALLLCLALCLGLAACGGKTEQAQESTTQPETENEELAERLEEPEEEIAEAETATVYVTIVDAGEIVVANEPVAVTDLDADGVYSVDEALRGAHEDFYNGEDGYASEETEYGLSLTRLWGVENGGSYGYYVNDAMAYSLGDALSDGDRLTAFSYSDLESWSDTYSYFDAEALTAAAGEELTLTLSAAGFDENWAPVVLAVEGAVITINGEATDFVTDADGCVTLTFDEAGEYLISASSDAMTLVPPVCCVTVE